MLYVCDKQDIFLGYIGKIINKTQKLILTKLICCAADLDYSQHLTSFCVQLISHSGNI